MKTSQDIRWNLTVEQISWRGQTYLPTRQSIMWSLYFVFISSFSPSLYRSSRCTLPCWPVQACLCYDSLSEYIQNTLPLSIVLSRALSLPVSLSRKSCYSRSLLLCSCTVPSCSSSSSIILSLSSLLPFPSSETLIAACLSTSLQ